jgi:hypothetical protein
MATEGTMTTQNRQEAQAELVEQALADSRIADAIRAWEAVRPFVPQQTFAAVTTTYSTSTSLTPGESGRA